jgi:hypothetical protein
LGLFKIEGHDQGEIKNLLSNVSVEKVVDATAILYTSDKKSMDNIKSQLNKVLYQTIHPKKIWIMCYSCKKPKKIEEALIKMVTDYQGIELNVKQVNQLPLWEGFDETTQWIQQYDIDTEYAWVLEPGFFPNSDYLYSVYGLLQTKEYQSSLIGTEGSLLPPAATLDNIGSTITCLSKVKQSQPADMIHGSWLLHSKWINIFREHPNINRLPLSYYISHTLLYYHDISTVLLPSQTLDSEETVKDEDTAMLCRSAQSLFKFPLKESSLPTTLDYQRVSGKGPEGHIAIVIHDQGQLSAMMPLVKRFLTQQKGTLISIIIYGDISTHDLKARLQQINFSTENVMIISISDSTKSADNVFKMTRLLEIIHPDVTLQIKEETMQYYAVVEVTNYQHITCISLLENEIKHGLWISDLPVQSLKGIFFFYLFV